MQKFRRYERPGDFDSKLANVWKVLKEVNERVHLIELRGEDSDLIADQLEHCMVWIALSYLSIYLNTYLLTSY